MNYPKLIPLALIGLIQACGANAPTISQNPPPPAKQDALAVASPGKTAEASRANESVANQPTPERDDLRATGDQRPPQASLPAYCAPDAYQEFFKQFVRGQDRQGNETRVAYTADRVEVRDYDNPSRVIGHLNRQDDEFSIDLRDYHWVQLVPSSVDNSPYTRLKLDIKRSGERLFRVDYIKAQYKYTGDVTGTESEELVQTYGNPGAYVFEQRHGCWHLIQKLQSTQSKAAVTSPVPPDQATTATHPVVQALAVKLSTNMIYSQLQTIMLADGWVPVVAPACKENVGAGSALCDQLPELASCRDHFCWMNFRHSTTNDKILVKVYHDANNWNVFGRDSKWWVNGWSFTPPDR